jgi:hyperosmotically inducible protein
MTRSLQTSTPARRTQGRTPRRISGLALPLVLAAAAALAACGRPADPLAGADTGRRADGTVADAGRSTGDAVRDAGRAIGQDAREAGRAVADKAKDATITTEVNTLLARDNQLSALKIDVDTREGQVVLSGTAPTDAARSRAADLARSVGGVLGVDNRLQVRQGG